MLKFGATRTPQILCCEAEIIAQYLPVFQLQLYSIYYFQCVSYFGSTVDPALYLIFPTVCSVTEDRRKQGLNIESIPVLVYSF